MALINESCARAQFRGENPIGKHIKLLGEPNSSAPCMTIVGIVGDVRIDHPADIQIYTALNHEAFIDYDRLVARTSGDPMRLERAVRASFDPVDSGSPVYHVKPLEGYLWGRLASRMFALALLTLFGALAFTLAAAGIYGAISYSVAQWTREAGIRMALGAEGRDVLTLVLSRALPAIGAGLAIGLGASLACTRMLTGLLFEVARPIRQRRWRLQLCSAWSHWPRPRFPRCAPRASIRSPRCAANEIISACIPCPDDRFSRPP